MKNRKTTSKSKIKIIFWHKLLILIFAFLSFSSISYSNNIQISSQAFVEQDFLNNYIMLQFDISWDNSWRTSIAPNNYDGVWLFIKYKKVSDGNWYHATLNTNSNNHNTGSQGLNASIQVSNAGTGAMFYRSNDGEGNFSSNNVKIRWEYGIDSISNNFAGEISEVRVFGIEMVYVPEGAFYIGSSGDESNYFYTYGENTPFYISSENAINVGNTNGYLFYSTGSGGDQEGPILIEFPKGFSAFWCMKYEITQEQYSEFLNTLTQTQQANRFPNEFYDSRHYIKQIDGIYGCDGNSNDTLNESNDGLNIACNWLSWADGAAYSDWAGLSPMTELEFEKACRGTLLPVPNEYAWGSTNITRASSIVNSKMDNEAASNSAANCNYSVSGNNLGGPIRVGCFTSGTRQSMGASYYGIMELSGNLWERPVTIGNSTGRSFTGLNGDGSLDSNGNANVSNWPNAGAVGSGLRGGNWHFNNNAACRVSDRLNAAVTHNDASSVYGFRSVIRFD